MIVSAHLWVFFLLVLGTVLLPGLDMAFVLGSALVGGRRAGLWAVAGLMAGAACHVAMGATGLAIVLQLFPATFNALLLAGGLYVAWVGVGLLRHAESLSLGVTSSAAAREPQACFRRAMFTNLLNPKAYVFMLAVFPQFIRQDGTPIAAQALVLGAIITGTQGLVYGAVACLAHEARAWLGGHPAGLRAITRGVGLLLLAVAAFTVWAGWSHTAP